jgi:hypothetical protein
MIAPDLELRLPSTEELPCSDDTPVDNVGVSPSRSEDQNLLPNLLLFALASIWASRMDCFFAVDMAVYHTTGNSPRVPVVPDGFLSLGVPRKKEGRSRQVIGGIEQEILTWFSQDGQVYPMPETILQELRTQLRVEREQLRLERADRLAEYLRSQGIDPDNLPE